jgi:glycogen operon protein
MAFSLFHRESGDYLHVILNTYWEVLEFEVPPLPDGYAWTRIVDTALHSPDDFCDPLDGPQVQGDRYLVEGRASVILLAQEIR